MIPMLRSTQKVLIRIYFITRSSESGSREVDSMVSPSHGHLVCPMHISDRSEMRAAEVVHPLQVPPPTVSDVAAYRISHMYLRTGLRDRQSHTDV